MKPNAVLSIDPSSTVPVYRQVVDNLRALLVNGTLEPGDTLPTVREMGLELGVHFNTVAEAYRLLADEGWLELKRRRGATVLARSTPTAKPEDLEHFRRRLRELVAQLRSAGLPIVNIVNELESMIRELTA